MAFICVSLMIDNTECLFMCLFAINIYLLVKYLSKSFAHFYWIICFLIIELCKLFFYWVGQKVLLGFSIWCWGKIQTNFLASPIYSRYQFFLIRYSFCKYFLPICGFYFHFIKCHYKKRSFGLFCFFFDHTACGNLVHQPGIKPHAHCSGSVES